MADLEKKIEKKDWVKLVEYVKDDRTMGNVYADNFKYNLQVSRIPYNIFEDPENSDYLWLYVRFFDVNRATRAYEIVVN